MHIALPTIVIPSYGCKSLQGSAHLAAEEVGGKAQLLGPGQHDEAEGHDVGLQSPAGHRHQFLGEVDANLHIDNLDIDSFTLTACIAAIGDVCSPIVSIIAHYLHADY